MNWSKAFGAGVTAAIVMTVLMFMARLIGLTTLNLEMALGSLLTQTIGGGTWLLGLFMHLVAGGVFALLYAWGFERISHRANARIGTLYGVVHTLFSGIIIMGLMPAIHPLIPGQIPAPGLFAANFGFLTLVAFIALHLIYGAIVGAIYGPVKQARVSDIEREEDEERRKAA